MSRGSRKMALGVFFSIGIIALGLILILDGATITTPSPTTPPSQLRTLSLSFQVTESPTSVLIAGASVTLNYTEVTGEAMVKNALTGSNGIAAFALQTNATQFGWSISAISYNTRTGIITVPLTANSYTVNILLTRSASGVLFNAEDQQGGGISGISITIAGQTGQTDLNGQLFVELPAGTYSWQVNGCTRCTPQSGSVTVVSGVSVVEILVNIPALSITGLPESLSPIGAIGLGAFMIVLGLLILIGLKKQLNR